MFRRHDHPELREGEVVTGNVRKSHSHSVGWTTKRIGVKAYDENDLFIDEELGMVPVFVQKSEIRAKGQDPDDYSK